MASLSVLSRDKSSETYYYRMVIPSELRVYFLGKTEFKTSLRTKDRAEAAQKVASYMQHAETSIAWARASHNKSQTHTLVSLKDVADRWMYHEWRRVMKENNPPETRFS